MENVPNMRYSINQQDMMEATQVQNPAKMDIISNFDMRGCAGRRDPPYFLRAQGDEMAQF